MAEYVFTNNAWAALSSSLGTADLSAAVETGQGARFPDIDGTTGEVFMAYIFPPDESYYEIVKVTVRSTDTFTITRAQEGTSAAYFPSGSKIRLRLTAGILESFLQKGVYTSYAGDPTNNVTPEYIGEECFDTTNEEWYKSVGLTSADWKIITPGT